MSGATYNSGEYRLMGLGSVISGIFGGGFAKAVESVGNVVDKFHTSDEEKLQAKLEMEKVLKDLRMEVEQTAQKELEARSEVIVAEAKGGSWLQRNWRPMLMCLFGLIIANNYVLSPYLQALFDFSVALEIPPDMWALLKLGVSGYIVGRSAEKGIEAWKTPKK